MTAWKDSTPFDLMNHNTRGQKSSEWVGGPACTQKASTSKTFTLFVRGLHLNVKRKGIRCPQLLSWIQPTVLSQNLFLNNSYLPLKMV